MITFTVPGPPHGKGRARSTRGGRHYTPAKTVQYEALVAAKCARAMSPHPGVPFIGAVAVVITAYRARPNKPGPSHECRAGHVRYGWEHRYCTSGCDADNLAKAILDGMTQGRAWGDDRQVVILRVSKLWCLEGEEARVDVATQAVGS